MTWTHLSFSKEQHSNHGEEAEVKRQEQDDTAETGEHTQGGVEKPRESVRNLHLSRLFIDLKYTPFTYRGAAGSTRMLSPVNSHLKVSFNDILNLPQYQNRESLQ